MCETSIRSILEAYEDARETDWMNEWEVKDEILR